MNFHQMDKLCVAHGATSIADAIEATSQSIIRRRSGYKYDRYSARSEGFVEEADSDSSDCYAAYHYDVGDR